MSETRFGIRLPLCVLFPVVGLCGCFNNISDEGVVTSASRSPSSTLPAFKDYEIIKSVASIEGQVVTTYRSALDPSRYGIILNIESAMNEYLGTAGLNSFVNGAEKASEQEKFKIQVPDFGFTLTVPVKRLVKGKALQNIIHIPPAFPYGSSRRIDFTQGKTQDSAPAIQLKAGQMPVAIFGGTLLSSPVNYFSLFFSDPITGGSGLYPNQNAPGFGKYFPAQVPYGIVPELIPLNATLTGVFKRVFRNYDGSLRNGVPSSLNGVDGLNRDAYFMAVYRRGDRIEQVNIVFPYTVNDGKPVADEFTFCNSVFDDDDQYYFGAVDNNAIYGRHPQSCSCVGARPIPATIAGLTVHESFRRADPCNGTNDKESAIRTALASVSPAPTYGRFVNGEIEYDGVVISPR